MAQPTRISLHAILTSCLISMSRTLLIRGVCMYSSVVRSTPFVLSRPWFLRTIFIICVLSVLLVVLHFFLCPLLLIIIIFVLPLTSSCHCHQFSSPQRHLSPSGGFKSRQSRAYPIRRTQCRRGRLADRPPRLPFRHPRVPIVQMERRSSSSGVRWLPTNPASTPDNDALEQHNERWPSRIPGNSAES